MRPPPWSRSTGCGRAAPSDDDLLALAAELGSDVPFALVGGTARGTGRGEVVSPLADDDASLWWVVVPDDTGLSTPEVYAEFDAAPGIGSGRPAPEWVDLDYLGILASLRNDLQDPALRLRPDLAVTRDLLTDAGADAVLLSGSGPTFLGLVRDRDASHDVVERLADRDVLGVRIATGPVAGAHVVEYVLVANLLNLERVSKAYGVRPLLTDVSLGIAAGERIGIVGRNGDGKTTLLEVMTGLEPPDSGRVSQSRGLLIGYLHQGDELVDSHSVREVVLGGRSDHEWAADPQLREIVDELLAGVELDRAVLGLSGGERRRCALAALLLGDHDLVVLDEPTNHLDVEAVAWLADHLAQRASALVVVTHDRWFLDAVCQWTWEVHDGVVDAYEGGYAAFVLAKAERQRQAAASEVRRQNLVRKELAWLRRGPPARTAKPKFRIDAATALIEDVPPPRDRLELQRFATQRLGKDVIDIEDVDLTRGPRQLLSHATWRLGPGDRVGIVGVNGAGKTSVLSLLSGTLAPDVGRVRHGRTVAIQQLTQELDDLDPESRVLATVESIRRVTRTADGDVTATVDARAFRLHRRSAHGAARRPVRRGAAALPAAAAAAHRAQRAAARRAHQRPRHRDPQRARGLPRRLARHARRRLPRPLLPRARHRLDLGAARRRADLDAASGRRRVPRASSRLLAAESRGRGGTGSQRRRLRPRPSPAVRRSGTLARPWPAWTGSWSGSPHRRPS